MTTGLDAQILMNVLQETLARQQGGGLAPGTVQPTGVGQELTWTKFKEQANGQKGNSMLSVRTKETSLTVPTNTLYGCTGLFGLCGPDEILGLTMMDDPLISWLGFVPDTICEKSIKGWTYIDQEGTAAGSVVGSVYGAPCDDPPKAEKSVCEFYIGDFGTYRGCGEAVDITLTGVRKCDKQPTYTIPVEGVGPVRIDNDLDLETISAGQLVKHEVSRHAITGDKNTAYQMDGLEQLVKTGYTSIQGEACTAMDSYVLDWSNDDLAGATNGYGSIIGAVRDMFRWIRWRVMQTGLGQPAEGDMVLVMPSWVAWRFLDEWAFWSFTERTVNSTQVVLRDNLDIRAFRRDHEGGQFGSGFITFDNYNLHILAHDWLTINQNAPNFCADIYLLTRSIGGRRVFNGQYIPANMAADAVASNAGYRYFNVEPIQGGRGIRWMKFDNACVQPCVLFRPRLYLETPWAQGKIENVCVDAGPFAPDSVDPQSSYFIEENKVAAASITQYWYDDEGWFH